MISCVDKINRNALVCLAYYMQQSNALGLEGGGNKQMFAILNEFKDGISYFGSIHILHNSICPDQK